MERDSGPERTPLIHISRPSTSFRVKRSGSWAMILSWKRRTLLRDRAGNFLWPHASAHRRGGKLSRCGFSSSFSHWNRNAGLRQPRSGIEKRNCCTLRLFQESGWNGFYLHLPSRRRRPLPEKQSNFAGCERLRARPSGPLGNWWATSIFLQTFWQLPCGAMKWVVSLSAQGESTRHVRGVGSELDCSWFAGAWKQQWLR